MKYKNDPYPTDAGFSSTCPGCRKPIKRGDPIIYWPATKSAYCAPCGEPDYRRFLAEAQDEEMYNQAYGP